MAGVGANTADPGLRDRVGVADLAAAAGRSTASAELSPQRAELAGDPGFHPSEQRPLAGDPGMAGVGGLGAGGGDGDAVAAAVVGAGDYRGGAEIGAEY